jgi:hypothetical protein
VGLLRIEARLHLGFALHLRLGDHAGSLLCTSEGLCPSFASRLLLRSVPGFSLRCDACFLCLAACFLFGLSLSFFLRHGPCFLVNPMLAP